MEGLELEVAGEVEFVLNNAKPTPEINPIEKLPLLLSALSDELWFGFVLLFSWSPFLLLSHNLFHCISNTTWILCHNVVDVSTSRFIRKGNLDNQINDLYLAGQRLKEMNLLLVPPPL